MCSACDRRPSLVAAWWQGCGERVGGERVLDAEHEAAGGAGPFAERGVADDQVAGSQRERAPVDPGADRIQALAGERNGKRPRRQREPGSDFHRQARTDSPLPEAVIFVGSRSVVD